MSRKNLSPPAFVVFRAITIVLFLGGLALLLFSAEVSQNGELGGSPINWGLAVSGSLLLLIGLIGPLRIIIKGAEIPAEVRQMIIIQAVALPMAGIGLIVAGLKLSTGLESVGTIITGMAAIIAALGGFLPLSRKLPRNFTMSELLNILKSTGISGAKEESAANREFMRWSNGVRDGVAAGSPPPDGVAVTMEGESRQLSSYWHADDAMPLVLNFASYTCPHHRKRIEELHALMANWVPAGVRFLTIYTAEAHPEDGWKLAHQYDNDTEFTGDDDFCFYYAATMDDRKKMAQWLIEKKQFQMTVVLDTMDNALLAAYNSWPIRLYIIAAGKIAYCGDQGPFGYDPAGVDDALRRLNLSG